MFFPLSEGTRERLVAAGLDPDDVAALVRAAVREDLGGGVDVTSVATVGADDVSRATVGARRPGTVAGVPVGAAVIEAVCGPANVAVDVVAGDGARVGVGDVVLAIEAPTVALLTAERSMLNLMCHLSGVATLTRAWADALEGTRARVRDTRKTTPGLRALEKYAVRCGGGANHRFGLDDAVLIKDNHLVVAGGVAAAVERARCFVGHLVKIEVEVATLAQLDEALAVGVEAVLLDNFDVAKLRGAVVRVAGRAITEASGGITLATARAVADTGVDLLSVGALTHSAPALDVALDFD